MKSIRIANGQGFWGDSIDAPVDLINYGKIDYLTLDYLAEVTLSIMQRQKNKNPHLGYATDFVELVNNNVKNIKKNNIKIIANAGGVNPESCKQELLKIAEQKKIDMKVAVIKGDDIYSQLNELIKKGQTFENLNDGRNFDLIKDKVCSANVYIDSFCIAEALSLGADIVLCGRVSDPGLVVGPCIYEFGWSRNDFNKLASATVAGHVVECGAQCTGGNFTKWNQVDNFSNIGYPIVSIDETGVFDIIKPPNTGGLINYYTVAEQILYELGDPTCYISPDVCVDFTSIKLSDLGDNVVRISRVKGSPPTKTYKVSVSYHNGYKASGQLTVSGPDAIIKANLAADIVWEKLKKTKNIFDDTSTELLGLSSCYRGLSKIPDVVNEVVLRLGVKSSSMGMVHRFTKELSPLITAGPPGITGFSEGRPRVREIIAYWPTLIDKNMIHTEAIL